MSDARPLGEELRGELIKRLDQPVALFDNDPELDDHDPDYGAHLQIVSNTRIVVVDLPNVATNGYCCWGRWAADNEFHEQPLRRDEVVDFFVGALSNPPQLSIRTS